MTPWVDYDLVGEWCEQDIRACFEVFCAPACRALTNAMIEQIGTSVADLWPKNKNAQSTSIRQVDEDLAEGLRTQLEDLPQEITGPRTEALYTSTLGSSLAKMYFSVNDGRVRTILHFRMGSSCRSVRQVHSTEVWPPVQPIQLRQTEFPKLERLGAYIFEKIDTLEPEGVAEAFTKKNMIGVNLMVPIESLLSFFLYAARKSNRKDREYQAKFDFELVDIADSLRLPREAILAHRVHGVCLETAEDKWERFCQVIQNMGSQAPSAYPAFLAYVLLIAAGYCESKADAARVIASEGWYTEANTKSHLTRMSERVAAGLEVVDPEQMRHEICLKLAKSQHEVSNRQIAVALGEEWERRLHPYLEAAAHVYAHSNQVFWELFDATIVHDELRQLCNNVRVGRWQPKR